MRYPLDEAKRFSGDAAAGSGRAAWRGMFPPVCQELYVARRRARAIAQAIFTRTAALRIARAMPPRRPVATAARLGSKSASRIGPPAAAFDIGRALQPRRRVVAAIAGAPRPMNRHESGEAATAPPPRLRPTGREQRQIVRGKIYRDTILWRKAA